MPIFTDKLIEDVLKETIVKLNVVTLNCQICGLKKMPRHATGGRSLKFFKIRRDIDKAAQYFKRQAIAIHIQFFKRALIPNKSKGHYFLAGFIFKNAKVFFRKV